MSLDCSLGTKDLHEKEENEDNLNWFSLGSLIDAFMGEIITKEFQLGSLFFQFLSTAISVKFIMRIFDFRIARK